MRQTITIEAHDEVRLDEDWGYPIGIVAGGIAINLIGDKAIDAMRAALDLLQRERDEHTARLNGEPAEAEALSSCGPELAGFESEVA